MQHYRLPLDRLHYDITSAYCEGLYTESEFVQFGYRRDQRPDSKQINLGLNVTGEGLPLAFRVLVGNTAEILIISPHDSGPAALAAFVRAFPGIYRTLKVGEAIQFQ